MGNISEIYINLEPILDAASAGVKNYTISFVEELKLQPVSLLGFVDDRYFDLTDTPLNEDAIQSALQNGDYLDYAKIANDNIVAIYFSPRSKDKQFKFEVEVVHDLGILLCSEYHERGMVKKLSPVIHKSLAQNDLIFTVSDSTKYQVDTYFHSLDVDSVTIGCASYLDNVSEPTINEPFRPYLLILGTVEPRKNHQLIFEMIKQYPEVLESYDFVIAGKFGWGKTITQIAHDKGIDISKFAGKISYINEITESEKSLLIRNASATIYPSFYEGFGMPVLESIALGTPVICSLSSSLVEASGGLGFYFDPLSPDELFQQIRKLESLSSESVNRLLQSMSEFSERQTWGSIVERAMHELSLIVGES